MGNTDRYQSMYRLDIETEVLNVLAEWGCRTIADVQAIWSDATMLAHLTETQAQSIARGLKRFVDLGTTGVYSGQEG